MAAPTYTYLHRLIPVSRGAPCPICGKIDWCRVRTDGAVQCMRRESDRPYKGEGGGYWHNLPGRGGAPVASPPPAPAVAEPEAPAISIAEAATLDAVYAALLAACPLGQAHRDYLTGPRCRIPADDLGGYGTLPAGERQRQMIEALVARFGRETLRGVPGFLETGQELRLSGSGLLVAYRDGQGRIIGCQLRKAAGGYYWLSSAKAGGPSCGSPAHVVDRGTPTVWLTEGAKKGHIASLRTGCTTVSMAGHANHRSALQALEALAGRGALAVVIALDADDDPKTAAAVEESRRTLADALLAMGYAVRIARWAHRDGKGIDDLLLAGHRPTIEIVRARRLDEDGGADCGEGVRLDSLTLAQQAARYRVIRGVIRNRGEDRTPSMKPVQKLALMANYELAGYPGAGPGQGSADAQQVNMGTLGALIGCSPQTASKAATSLAAEGLLRREDAKKPAPDGMIHTVVSLAPGRPLAFNEQLPQAEHHRADRARKRTCKECGGDVESTIRHVCQGCGTVEEEPWPRTPERPRRPVERRFLRKRPERPGARHAEEDDVEAPDDAPAAAPTHGIRESAGAARAGAAGGKLSATDSRKITPIKAGWSLPTHGIRDSAAADDPLRRPPAQRGDLSHTYPWASEAPP